MEFTDVPFIKDPDDPTLSPLMRHIITQLKTVFDPEIPVDIYELGLIYAIEINEKTHEVDIYMTLTAPGCPVAGVMPDWVRSAVEGIEEVERCQVNMVWDPPWRMEMMSLRARLELNII